MSIFELVWTDQVFSAEDCDQIVDMYQNRRFEDGLIQDNKADYSSRVAQLQFIPPADENLWVFDKLQQIIQSANETTFHFKLRGFEEGFQFSKYGVGGHYRWHVDLGARERGTRKLSLTLQLSKPDDYDGGELQFFPMAAQAPKTQGLVAVFPSFVPHRVAPVTRGTRFSLVSWVAGKQPFA